MPLGGDMSVVPFKNIVPTCSLLVHVNNPWLVKRLETIYGVVIYETEDLITLLRDNTLGPVERYALFNNIVLINRDFRLRVVGKLWNDVLKPRQLMKQFDPRLKYIDKIIDVEAIFAHDTALLRHTLNGRDIKNCRDVVYLSVNRFKHILKNPDN